ncbi:hypothetical protein HHK36_012080 [Tetracentron sinense]|uniref:Uncharacterized protein n=1 Tax=Tetracentron sinense TaxID=13715 RepID=A0A834ZBX6_TETSI|nr:hypothetical protein HHK36_012080 [Tetracentron sinense]
MRNPSSKSQVAEAVAASSSTSKTPCCVKPLNPNSSEDVHAPAAKADNSPNPNSSGLDETSGSRRIILDKANGYFKGTKLNQDYSGVVGDGHENWKNSDGLIMAGFQSIHGNSNEEDDIEYCTDDMFSSFLNSLINEDMFASQHQQQQQQSNVIAPPLDPLLPSAQTFGGYGTLWEAALTSSTAALNDSQQKWFVDHANKHP